MKDRVFIDTNILIYFISDEEPKKQIAKRILVDDPILKVLSSQVIGEFVNVSIKKNLLPKEETYLVAKVFMKNLAFTLIDQESLNKSFDIQLRYNYSFWDSLIIASAITSGCSILYTEDMQHNQLIEGTLRIVNPFVYERG